MPNTEQKESARILKPYDPPVMGGTDGVATPKAVPDGSASAGAPKAGNGTGTHTTNGTHGTNGTQATQAHRPPPIGVISRRQQLRRAYTIIKLFLWFVAMVKWGRWFTKDLDQTIRSCDLCRRSLIMRRCWTSNSSGSSPTSLKADWLPVG